MMGLGCSDPCSLVVGCEEPRHVAVEGRVLTAGADPVAGVSVHLLAIYPDHVDSSEAVTDSRGLFSLSVLAPGSTAPLTSVRVTPPGRPGYVIPVANCQPVSVRGDGCILEAVKPEPRFRGFLFHYRSDNSPAEGVRVTFRRTGGARLYQDPVRNSLTEVDSVTTVTNDIGFAFLFPLDVWTGSLEPVIGDLIVDLPAAAGGRTVQQGFAVSPVPYFFVEGLEMQLVGPATLPPAGGR